MKIRINGKPFECEIGESLPDVLMRFGAKEPFALALNGTFVPRSRCSAVELSEGDALELLSPVQGG